VLLVTSRTTRRWVLPKGSIGSGLTAYQAAVVEAYEEAGIGGRIGRTCLGVYGYTKRNDKKPKRCLVRVFPLRVGTILPEWPERRQRRRQWVSIHIAGARVQEPALKKILCAFERRQLERARGRLAAARPEEPCRCSVGRTSAYISHALPVADGGMARRDYLEAAGWADRFLRGKDQGAQPKPRGDPAVLPGRLRGRVADGLRRNPDPQGVRWRRRVPEQPVQERLKPGVSRLLRTELLEPT
jgi:8-oxo-dGTP pyrophosphatase MutT (NUDIX family)